MNAGNGIATGYDAAGTFYHPSALPAEPICPKCGEPIQWVLDMFSFSTLSGGRFELLHARCAWTKDGFRAQEAQAPDG